VTPNQYPWAEIDLSRAAEVDPVACVLHHGINALCKQLTLLTDAVRALGPKEAQ
jgi:hypothetical protein